MVVPIWTVLAKDKENKFSFSVLVSHQFKQKEPITLLRSEVVCKTRATTFEIRIDRSNDTDYRMHPCYQSLEYLTS